MRVQIIAVGQKMPEWVDSAVGEYVKRLPPEWRFELKELRAGQRSGSKNAKTVMAEEAERIEAAAKDTVIVALDEHGKDLSSVALSELLKAYARDGKNVSFVIGGADGLDADFKKKADRLVSISPMTLPHGLVRVLLAEQLYRAHTLLTGHPYHRA